VLDEPHDLSVATFICFRLPAWHRTVRKQLVKAPKLHFVNTGLACHLLGMYVVSESGNFLPALVAP
jgi:hypothetical protein